MGAPAEATAQHDDRDDRDDGGETTRHVEARDRGGGVSRPYAHAVRDEEAAARR